MDKLNNCVIIHNQQYLNLYISEAVKNGYTYIKGRNVLCNELEIVKNLLFGNAVQKLRGERFDKITIHRANFLKWNEYELMDELIIVANLRLNENGEVIVKGEYYEKDN